MQIMMMKVRNLFIDYLGTNGGIIMDGYEEIRGNDVRAFIRTPIYPDFIVWLDHEKETGWVVVRDTPENIVAFNKRFKDVEIPDSVTIYYNEPYYYDLIKDGVDTRHRIKEEKERQDRINNPKVDLGVNSKEELIEYLINEVISNEELLIHEYSTDYDVSMAELNEKEKVLRDLANKYL